MIVACGTVIFRHFTLEEALQEIHDAGYKYVETQATMPFCSHVNPWKDDPEVYKNTVQGFGFKGTTALWATDGAIIPNDKSVESVKVCLQWAKAADIPVVNFGDGFKPDDMSDDDAWRIFKDRLHILTEEARKLNVKLAIEPHGTFSLTRAGLEKIMELEGPPLGVNYDAANIYRSGYVQSEGGKSDWQSIESNEDEVDVVKGIADRVVHYHVKDYVLEDNECVALGLGGVKNKEVCQVLKKAGYNGALSLETEGHEDMDVCRRIIRQSKPYLDKLANA